jgi:hypothetical protein
VPELRYTNVFNFATSIRTTRPPRKSIAPIAQRREIASDDDVVAPVARVA